MTQLPGNRTCDGLGLGLGQAQRPCARRLAAVRGDSSTPGADDLEGKAQARQEVGPVARGRSQDEGGAMALRA